MLNEVFPVVGGILLGLLIVGVRQSLRLWVAVPAAVVIGFLATVVSGEFRMGWEFLLIDIPLVAVAAVATVMVVRLVRRRAAGA
ncbi:hypothetical protein [Actinomadura rubrisoli]|uniref:Integral membrane protein n=1 Tax=Actinomadura rubrisoli TaxID=2530368 RepID=A0A4R5AF43_9ACTN|nr:hypothetical protein [Actinomadura rubrisoli]TDD71178.1 hypothetical protein E1298_35970 [Actinomadura rubrisoli]